MQNDFRLLLIKLIHTAIWLFFVVIIFYVLYCGIANKITAYTWIAAGLVVAEGVVLMLFKNHCPLTLLARNYSSSKDDNFDIFLPNWLAHYNKLIFTTIYLVGVIIISYRMLS